MRQSTSLPDRVNLAIVSASQDCGKQALWMLAMSSASLGMACPTKISMGISASPRPRLAALRPEAANRGAARREKSVLLRARSRQAPRRSAEALAASPQEAGRLACLLRQGG